MTTTTRILAAVTAGLAIALLAACGGGGGGGGGGPTEPPPPPTAFTFTASGASGASTVTLAQGAGTNATTFVLEVRANQVSGLYGVAFDLTYPSAALAFMQGAQGTILSNGAPTAFQVSEPSPGTLVVGLSRLGTVAGVDSNGVLLTLTFTARASGSGALVFRRNQVVGADGLPLIAVAWGAGAVQVNR